MLERLSDPEASVREHAARALGTISAQLSREDRRAFLSRFAALARSKDPASREAGYVGLRNVLAAGD